MTIAKTVQCDRPGCGNTLVIKDPGVNARPRRVLAAANWWTVEIEGGPSRLPGGSRVLHFCPECPPFPDPPTDGDGGASVREPRRPLPENPSGHVGFTATVTSTSYGDTGP